MSYDITDENFKTVVKTALINYLDVLYCAEKELLRKVDIKFLKDCLEICFARQGFDMYKLLKIEKIELLEY